MAQDFDKIFKQNFEQLLPTIAQRLLGIPKQQFKEIPDDLHYTIEKRPDFLKEVVADENTHSYILHIEIQSTDPKKMDGRMLVYYAFIFEKYRKPVKQYVIYIGRKKTPTMFTEIKHEQLNFKFTLLDIKNFNYKTFLNSNRPEDVVLAILCDFQDEPGKTVITKIIHKLKQLTNDELSMGKYCRQLEVLSKIRNLQDTFIEKVTEMDITYDLETDIRYLQGQNLAKERLATKAIPSFLKRFPDVSIKELAVFYDLPIGKIRQIIKELSSTLAISGSASGHKSQVV